MYVYIYIYTYIHTSNIVDIATYTRLYYIIIPRPYGRLPHSERHEASRAGGPRQYIQVKWSYAMRGGPKVEERPSNPAGTVTVARKLAASGSLARCGAAQRASRCRRAQRNSATKARTCGRKAQVIAEHRASGKRGNLNSSQHAVQKAKSLGGPPSWAACVSSHIAHLAAGKQTYYNYTISIHTI